MPKDLEALKSRLDREVARRNSLDELHLSRPDPIMPAREYKEEYSSLICALFGYGRADSIITFLYSLDISLLDSSECEIERALSDRYYRFQNGQDVVEIFRTLHRLKQEGPLESLFLEGYRQDQSVLTGLNRVIGMMRRVNAYQSRGYDFLVGKPIVKSRGNAAMKRWMMYLRWMVRKDHIDMGLWTRVHR